MSEEANVSVGEQGGVIRSFLVTLLKHDWGCRLHDAEVFWHGFCL